MVLKTSTIALSLLASLAFATVSTYSCTGPSFNSGTYCTSYGDSVIWWYYNFTPGFNSYFNYIADGVSSITYITINQGNSYLYGISVNGLTSVGANVNGHILSPVPNYQLSTAYQTVTVPTQTCVSSISVWYTLSGLRGYWKQV